MTKRISQQKLMRDELPYGKWTCPDGREVLFNRSYKPIWHRRIGSEAEAADREERVKFERQEWFYNDVTTPWRNKSTKKSCEAILAEWGVSVATA